LLNNTLYYKVEAVSIKATFVGAKNKMTKKIIFMKKIALPIAFPFPIVVLCRS